jgi:TonB family protein
MWTMNPLVDTALKVSVVILIALAAAVLLRRRSAALRHRVLAAAIVCAALMPAGRWIAPGWDLPFDVWGASEQRIEQADVARTELVMTASADERSRRGASLPGVSALVGLWMVGVVISLATLVVGLTRLTRLTARSTPIRDDRWTVVAGELTRTHGLRRPVALLVSEHPSMLVTWGLWRPTVLLPFDARKWQDNRIRATLAHEIAHVQRHDWGIHILAQVLRCLHWFNPIVWQACRSLRRESEHACDAAVLRSGIAAADYASALLDVARTAVRARRAPGCALAMAQPSTLERRVRAILGGQLNARPPCRHELALATFVLVAAAVPVAGYGAGSRPSPLRPPQAASSITHQDVTLANTPPLSATSVSSSPADRTPSSSPAAEAGSKDSAPFERSPAAVVRRAPLRFEPPVGEPDADAARASATISGAVVDPQGRRMTNVAIELQHLSSQSVWNATSDERGTFSFPGLAAGRYQLKATYPAFSTITTVVDLGEDESQVRNMTLRVGTAVESVTVTATGSRSAPTFPSGARVPGPGPGTAVSSAPSAGSTSRDRGECTDGGGGCLRPPMKVKDVKPLYPERAQESGTEGVVILEGTIDTDGTVSNMRTLRGVGGLSEAAQDAVRQWQYVPAKLNGAPVAIIVLVTVNFTLK